MNIVIIDAPTSNPLDTKVRLESGEALPGVSAIAVEIKPGHTNQAKLTFEGVELKDCCAAADLTPLVLTIAGELDQAGRRKLVAEINALPL